MSQVLLDVGVVEFTDTGGEGPCVVMFGGMTIGPTLWDHVVDNLRRDHRCIVLTIPWGGHRLPMHTDADLSLAGQTRIVTEAISQLGLQDVTVVENDTAMTQLMLADPPPWLRRAVITSCEAFDNYPAGLPGKMIGAFAKLPGGVNLIVQQLRLRAMRRSRLAYGQMMKRPFPDETVVGWVSHLQSDRLIRRDLAKYLRTFDKTALSRNAEFLSACPLPVLVAWAGDDALMPSEHGRRLADLLPHGRFVEIADSRTLIPMDQPDLLAETIRTFVAD